MLILLLIGLGLGYYGTHIQDASKKYQINSVALTYGSPSIYYDFTSKSDENVDFSYAPEVSMYSGLEVQGDYLSFGISFTDGLSSSEPEDTDYKPVSKVFDLQLSGVSNQVLWQAYYQRYKDLYYSEQIKDSPTQYHLNAVNYGLGVSYAFNSKVKLIELIGNSSLDKKTESSWLVGLHANHSELNSNFTIIPQEFSLFFPDLNEADEIHTTALSADIGWAGQFVYKSFFIGAIFSFGPAYQEQKIISSTTRKRFYQATNFNTELNVGFLFERSTFGLTTFMQRIQSEFSDADFGSNRSRAMFYYRYFF